MGRNGGNGDDIEAEPGDQPDPRTDTEDIPPADPTTNGSGR